MKRAQPVVKCCLVCSKEFKVPQARKETAKYCSRTCSDAAPRQHNEVRCRECGTMFRKKASDSSKAIWGNFCGSGCLSSARSRLSSGENNPNWKGRNFDSDGYRLHASGKSYKGRKMKEHQYVAMLAAGLDEIPSGMHVHHKDCNALNNSEDNLIILTISDHKWIHQQVGVAILRGVQAGKIDAMFVAALTDDPQRASSILLGNCRSQGVLWQYLKGTGIDFAESTCLKPLRNVTFEQVEELGATERGSGGFGSTGKA